MREWTKLIRLLKIQFPEVFDLPFLRKGRKKRLSNSVLMVFLAAFVIFLSFVSFLYSYGLGLGLKSAGRVDMLIELAAAIASVAIFFTTVYKIRGIIFDFKDFDFLLALPVKYTTIVTGRLLLLYLINLPTTILIMVPAGISYCMLTGWDVAAFIYNIAGALLLPMLPVTLAAIVGILAAFFASRFRNSKVINIILIFIILFGFMAVPYFGGLGSLDSMTQIYPPAVLYESAFWKKEAAAIAGYLLISLGSFGIFSVVAGKRFIALNTQLVKKTGSRNRKGLQVRTDSPFCALYKKEVKRYFSSVNYVINTGFGMVLLTVLSIASLFLAPDTVSRLLKMPGAIEQLKQFLPEFMAFCLAMTCISASSISLEGKNLWLIKSLPLSAGRIFCSKIAVNLTMTAPLAFIDVLLLSIGLRLTIKEIIVLMVFDVSISVYTSVSGLFFNLLLPKFDWSSEITVIKQSMAVLASLFTGIVAAMVPKILAGALPSIAGFAVFLAYAVFLLSVSGLLYLAIMKSGEKRFRAFT